MLIKTTTQIQNDILAEKQNLRNKAKTTRQLISTENLSHFPSFKKLTQSPWFTKSKNISMYVSQSFEFPTQQLFDLCKNERKNIFIPTIHQTELFFYQATDWNKFITNEKNIREPIFGKEISPERIDLFFIPLVAFDRSGNRLGRGGGYFDRLFSNKNIRGKKIGVGFNEQEIFKVPHETHDILMDYILTETRLIQTL